MAEGQGRSPFETGTSPVVVVCIQLLAGSARSHPLELTVPGGRVSKTDWGWPQGQVRLPPYSARITEPFAASPGF